MQKLFENWREYIEEDTDSKLKDLFEHRIEQNCNKVQEGSLTELDIDIGPSHVRTEF